MVESIVLASLQIVAAIAPGFLAAFSGHDTDEAALDRATHALRDLPDHPGAHAIDDWRDSLARAPHPRK